MRRFFCTSLQKLHTYNKKTTKLKLMPYNIAIRNRSGLWHPTRRYDRINMRAKVLLNVCKCKSLIAECFVKTFQRFCTFIIKATLSLNCAKNASEIISTNKVVQAHTTADQKIHIYRISHHISANFAVSSHVCAICMFRIVPIDIIRCHLEVRQIIYHALCFFCICICSSISSWYGTTQKERCMLFQQEYLNKLWHLISMGYFGWNMILCVCVCVSKQQSTPHIQNT